MKKIQILFIALILTLTVTLFSGVSYTAFASENTETETEMSTETSTETETETESKLSKEEMQEIADEVMNSFSEEKISAILETIKKQDTAEKRIFAIGCVVVFGVIVLLIFVMLKKSGKANVSVAEATALAKQNNDLKQIINAIDLEHLPETISKTIINECEKIVKAVKPEYQTYAELKAEIDKMEAILNSLKVAAMSVWGNNDDARNALSQSPTNTVLLAKEKEIANLENVIREYKGEEAETIIATAKE